MLEKPTAHPNGSSSGPRAFVAPLVLMLGSMVAVASLPSKPSTTGPVAAIFPPWWSAARSLAAAGAGGAIVDRGAWPFVVIVAAGAADPDARLRQAGALVILDAETLRGCAALLETKTP